MLRLGEMTLSESLPWPSSTGFARAGPVFFYAQFAELHASFAGDAVNYMRGLLQPFKHYFGESSKWTWIFGLSLFYHRHSSLLAGLGLTFLEQPWAKFKIC